jgi:hypothetical protein
VGKENVVFQCNEVLLKKKNEIMMLTGKWMEINTILLTEISQIQRQISHVLSHIAESGFLKKRHKCKRGK